MDMEIVLHSINDKIGIVIKSDEAIGNVLLLDNDEDLTPLLFDTEKEAVEYLSKTFGESRE